MINFKIEHQPEFSWLTIQLEKGKKLFVEAGSMASMSSNVKMKALFKGGLGRFLTRESLFISEFKAEGVAGEITVAPGPFGDISHYELKDEVFFLSSSSYVAHTEGVQYETKFQKLSQGLLSGAGWFLVKLSGTGHVWFNGYGAIQEIQVQDEFLIDNGHIVAFSEGLEYNLIKLGGYKSLFFSGEGFVCQFRGQGRLFVQTKKPSALIKWAHRFRAVKSNN